MVYKPHCKNAILLLLQVAAVQAQDWNLSTSISSRNLQQSSRDSHAKHASHSRLYNKKVMHYTGPKKDVALLSEQLRQAKKQSALQLQTLTAMYGQEGAAAMQLMPKSKVCKHNWSPKVYPCPKVLRTICPLAFAM